MTHFARLFCCAALLFAFVGGIAAAGPKTGYLTADQMFGICGFEESPNRQFTDREYSAAYHYYTNLAMAAGVEADGDVQRERALGLRDGIVECRERDKAKDAAKKSYASCKALVANHRESVERAWALRARYPTDGALLNEMRRWAEYFRAPLEKCLKSMKCRLDNKQDMQEALDVYREVVDEMHVGGVHVLDKGENLQICGVSIRDIKRWCTATTTNSEGDEVNKDICTDPDFISIALSQLYDAMRPSPPPYYDSGVGGVFSGGG